MTGQDRSTTAVSIVIPTIRLDTDFRHALSSALAQEHPNVEVVVVLDGISPGTPDDERLLQHDRVVVVPLPKRVGTPRALNAGLAASSGVYIARLDADDIALPGRIAAQVTAMEGHPDIVALGTAYALIAPDGAVIGNAESGEGDLRAALVRSNTLVHSSMMFRASALTAVGGYNAACTRMQDYELYLRLGQVGEIRALPETLTYYRVHPKQSSRKSPVFSRSTVEITRQRLSLASHLGISRPRAAARSALWIGWQLLRQAKLVRPGYHRVVRSA